MEHGFTLSEPPGARRQGAPLRLALQVSADWQAVASEDGQLVTLRGARAAVEYGKLVVRDKLGRNIAAKLTGAGEQVVIEVEDHDAIYPLTIDPIFTLQQKLLAADGAASDAFGGAVALSGNTAVIGAPQDDVTGADQGTVYVFVRNGETWNQHARLNAVDGAANDYFGGAVALSGDTLVVGASFDDFGLTENQGSVYVFTRNGATWTQQQKLIAGDGVAEDRFGNALALGGDTLVVGAYADDVGANANQGSAYVFTRNGATQPVWTQQQKLSANDGAVQAAFGYAVALDQDTLVIGAPGYTIGANASQGSAYVFTRGGAGWILQQKLTADDGAAGDQFGYAAALGGATLTLGAPNNDLGAQANQGSAYVFVRNGSRWTQQQQLTANDGAAGDQFGCTVALNGELMVIGALFDDIGANNDQGSAYLFARNNVNWTQQRKLVAADGRKTDIFGVAVALERGTILLGASLADADAPDQGAVYAFVVRDNRRVEQQRLLADDAADGDNFGLAVALDADTLAVGAPRDAFGAATNQGSVYVFTRSGAAWTLQQKLFANDGARGDEFGVAVALIGDMLVVGAHQDDDDNDINPNQGSAYVFTRAGASWTQQQKLLANDGQIEDRFGSAVALSGKTIAVGAPLDRVGLKSRQGSVYLFTLSSARWIQQQQLTANDGAADSYFGVAIALGDDTLIVGSSSSNVGANNQQGAAYVFARAGDFWTQQQKLLANDGVAADRFGSSVALDGDTVVIGAASKSIDGNGGKGAAYIFARNGAVWTQQQRLTASDAETFGYAVALSGDTALIGAVLSDLGDNVNQGSAYVFTRAGTVWTQQLKLSASDGTD
ncbi:MAG: FG-GAP repeat protein, partial [Blastocatellia bacterium]